MSVRALRSLAGRSGLLQQTRKMSNLQAELPKYDPAAALPMSYAWVLMGITGVFWGLGYWVNPHNERIRHGTADKMDKWTKA